MNTTSSSSLSSTPGWLQHRVTAVVLWLLLIGSESTAQIAMKVGGDALTDLPFGLAWLDTALLTPAVLLALACYAGSFFVWMLILRSAPVSVAFPLSSLVFVGVLLGSWLGLGEQIDWLRWVGVAIIISGIAVMAEGEG
ncbi:EamA family transporter [uncultured Pseudomonas sp.]|uniref:DMT family transporter n=1 Tax=uncultured Pseudomonas sp. TaxID=114707 RepID=UPI0025DFEFDA|nr:EamA family transporter [uncultured Pseudomonas sp.]